MSRHIHYNSLLVSLEQINRYLKATPEDVNAERKFEKYILLAVNRSAANRDFRLISIGLDPDIEKHIEQLFESLNINKNEWILYFDPKLTVQQFLNEVYEKNPSYKLKHVIELINKRVAFSKLQLLLMGLCIVGLALISFLVPPLQTVLIATIDLTIIGLVYTATVALFKLRQNYYCELNKTNFAKIRDLFFLVSNITFNMTAYGLWISSAAIMSPLIAGLFIAASVIDVCKELFLGIENHIRYNEEKKILASTGKNYAQNIKIARVDYESRKHRRAALINFTGALVLAGLIAAWCFIPGIIVSLGIVGAILIVQAAQHYANKSNSADNKNKLIAKMQIIHNDYELQELKKIRPPQSNYMGYLPQRRASDANTRSSLTLQTPEKRHSLMFPGDKLFESNSKFGAGKETSFARPQSHFTPGSPNHRCSQDSFFKYRDLAKSTPFKSPVSKFDINELSDEDPCDTVKTGQGV
ncbi:MAG: hypothetical protein H0U75_09505 [Legionella sp.]|nr:hypothetical protein [Legionella sp.]